MSGHSKWANIKRRKAAVDAKKGKVFTRLAREIIVAAREGGGDPEANFRLKAAIQRAKEANLPNENVLRAIQKGTGGGEGAGYEEVAYEGYGPGGVAMLVLTMTDNRNRTAADIRHLFSKHGGNLGEAGCVSWLFEPRGLIIIDRARTDISEDELMLAALEAGADDVQTEEDSFEVLTKPEDFNAVRAALEAQGLPIAEAELTRIPKTTVPLSGEEAEKVNRLIEALEDYDDVQEVYTNLEEQ
ncbi:MAG: YebC/PmpR family DNA-binding transcriptional regulator [Thermoanaerobacterales bacterium]|nr:YebC/PmpR family DNA-binding transcriptional regulator [Thermoanaerobacterales bacterium]